ncbi:unnamed protein product, partial [Adineta ricciae]
MLNSDIKNIDDSLRSVTERLREMYEADNFVEDDLTQLGAIICELENNFQQLTNSSRIALNKENSEQLDWNLLIYVDSKNTHDQKADVPCPSEDINCQWKGPLDEINNHIVVCAFIPRRSKI